VQVTITLPSLPPAEYSANYARGRHWAVKQKITTAAHDEIIAALLEQGWRSDGEPLAKAMVTVTFYLPDRRKRDHGGLVERFKPWLDALTRNPDPRTGVWRGAGVLWDDDLETIGWPVYGHCYSPRKPLTVVEVVGFL